ncbi:MAG TPA: hypothetical protein VI997_09540, partial [Candidatus Thermoplasmatota archaeon]|nr:hypothetical protein [Candidatus Thermoplasmatota archaeon]
LSPFAAEHAGEPSVASLALVVARAISRRNADLAGLALAGARASAGPPAALRGLDAEILAEAVGEGRLTRGPPLAWPETVLELLASGVEPLVPSLAGRARAGKRFLDELKIDADQPASSLDEDRRRLLADRLVRRALATGAAVAVADGLLEPDLRATTGPFAGAPIREVASRLAAAAETAPADALAHALGHADAPLPREDPARSLHGLLAASRGGAFAVAEAPTPALLAETVRRLHVTDPTRPAVAWAPLDGKAALRILGVAGSTVAEAARACGGRGAGSATRGRALVPAEQRESMLGVLGGLLQ